MYLRVYRIRKINFTSVAYITNRHPDRYEFAAMAVATIRLQYVYISAICTSVTARFASSLSRNCDIIMVDK